MDYLDIKEADKAVRNLSDKARKSRRIGKEILVPHKFKEDGEVVTSENFNPRTDLSKLNQKHWQFLEIFQKNGWNLEAACKESGLELDVVKKIHKKIQYFEFEKQREAGLASLLTPAFIKSKHIDNVFTNQLQDSQLKSLDQLAKIEGLHKSTSLNLHAHVFQRPPMTPEQEEAMRVAFDAMPMPGEAHVA